MNNAQKNQNQGVKPPVKKFIFLGEVGVGKTSLLLRYCENTFSEDTPNLDFKEKMVQVNDKLTKLRLFDTAGQELFRTITSSYYHGSDAVILVYDITRRETFEKLKGWLADIQLYGKARIPKVLLGNKVDLDAKREVSKDEAELLAKSSDISVYVETSAKNGTNVEKAFLDLLGVLVASDAVQPTEPVRNRIQITATTEKEKNCC